MKLKKREKLVKAKRTPRISEILDQFLCRSEKERLVLFNGDIENLEICPLQVLFNTVNFLSECLKCCHNYLCRIYIYEKLINSMNIYLFSIVACFVFFLSQNE